MEWPQETNRPFPERRGCLSPVELSGTRGTKKSSGRFKTLAYPQTLIYVLAAPNHPIFADAEVRISPTVCFIVLLGLHQT